MGAVYDFVRLLSMRRGDLQGLGPDPWALGRSSPWAVSGPGKTHTIRIRATFGRGSNNVSDVYLLYRTFYTNIIFLGIIHRPVFI
jgi:hypothetical protein